MSYPARAEGLVNSTSHFFERIVCERELETEQNCNILTPPNSSGYNSISFPFSWAAQPGAWGPSLCWDMVLIPPSSLQLIWTSCRQGYIIIWRPPTSCKRLNSHLIQPVDSQGYPPISLTGYTCYLHRCISHLTARSGRRSIFNNIYRKAIFNPLQLSVKSYQKTLFNSV